MNDNRPITSTIKNTDLRDIPIEQLDAIFNPTEDKKIYRRGLISTFKEKAELIGQQVLIQENPETKSFIGTITEIQESEIDGILVSVVDQNGTLSENHDIFDISQEYIILLNKQGGLK